MFDLTKSVFNIFSLNQKTEKPYDRPNLKRPNSGSLTKRRGSRKARSLRSTHLAVLSSTYAMTKNMSDDVDNISTGSTPTPTIGIKLIENVVYGIISNK